MIRAFAFLLTLFVAFATFAGFQLKQLQTVQLSISEATLYPVKAGTGVNSMCSALKIMAG